MIKNGQELINMVQGSHKWSQTMKNAEMRVSNGA